MREIFRIYYFKDESFYPIEFRYPYPNKFKRIDLRSEHLISGSFFFAL